MECPKCGGGAFLSEEELVRIIENVAPMKVVSKATYQCRACSERFSRLTCDDLDSRKKPAEDNVPAGYAPAEPASPSSSGEPADGIKFLDRI
jgi:hypothetical protein